MSTTPMTKIREEFADFINNPSTFPPTVEDIADWFINRFQQELEKLEGEIEKIDISGGGSGRRLKEQVLAIIRQHKEG